MCFHLFSCRVYFLSILLAPTLVRSPILGVWDVLYESFMFCVPKLKIHFKHDNCLSLDIFGIPVLIETFTYKLL